jgi:hypothetical protein
MIEEMIPERYEDDIDETFWELYDADEDFMNYPVRVGGPEHRFLKRILETMRQVQ